jgi:hypothetical protein
MSLFRPTAHNFATKLTCVAGVLVVSLGILAAPAMAGRTAPEGQSSGDCSVSPLSKPFERFGDGASYSPGPGGSFEVAGAGWSLTNAAVASGNESFAVAAARTRSRSSRTASRPARKYVQADRQDLGSRR